MGKGYMGSESKCPNIYRHIGIGNAIKYVPNRFALFVIL